MANTVSRRMTSSVGKFLFPIESLLDSLTLLMAQWVDKGPLENKNHAFFSCFFDFA